jgi:hypothetical protein
MFWPWPAVAKLRYQTKGCLKKASMDFSETEGQKARAVRNPIGK